MGIFAFLTASRLKTEITRQRDEIARLHQLIDLEGAHRKEAEKYSEERARKCQELEHENREFLVQLKAQEATFHERSTQLKEKVEGEAQRLREQTAAKERDMDVRVATLRQELDERQRQRSEATEQSARLAERISQLEKTLEDLRQTLQDREARIGELGAENEKLKRDLTRIMGNLSKW